MFYNKKQIVFKALLVALVSLFFQATAFAQAIEIGVYNVENGSHPISIDYDKNGILLFKDFRGTEKFRMESKNKYVHLTYPTQSLTLIGTDKVVHADAANGYKREFLLYAPRSANPVEGVIKFKVDEDYYFATETRDCRFVGLYKYLGKEPTLFKYPAGEQVEGSPIVDLKMNGTGEYQGHGTIKYNIRWWIETDYKGSISEIDLTLFKRYYLVIQFKEGQFAEEFSRMHLDVYSDGSKAVIMGERERELNCNTSSISKPINKSKISTSEADNNQVTGTISGSGSGNNAQRSTTKTSTTPASAAAKDMVDYKEVAKGYQAKMKSDPAKAQVYSFCAAAALAKSSLSEEAFEVYAKKIAASLKTVVEDKAPCPCSDVIPAQAWKEAGK